MKQEIKENMHHIRFIAAAFLVTTSLGVTAVNTYKLNKEYKEIFASLDNNNKEKDLHISETLDYVDDINSKFQEVEDESTTEVVLFDDNSDDYYNLETNEYITDEEILAQDEFVVTTDNKTYEHLSDKDFELFVACVAAESNKNKYDALAVATSILNRCVSDKWVNDLNKKGMDGNNPIDHLKAEGQYSVYSEGYYEKYLNYNVPDEVLKACESAWYNGIRNHNYCSFRNSGATSYSNNQIVKGGNRFNDEVKQKQVKYKVYIRNNVAYKIGS